MNLSVYFVTPERAEQPLAELVLAAVRGGAGVVQLRDKTATDAEMVRVARDLRALLVPLGVPLIINDRVEVMLASGADGLHVGQGDAPVEEMRRLIGGRILGLSIETLAQVQAMPDAVVDYIGVGPIYATATKPDAAAPLGMRGLAEIVRAARVPVVAIGGIGLADVAPVRETGAAGLAVVSAIAAAADPERATRDLVAAWEGAA
ncbi:MAG: thiamine phosphate synthase [Paracoccaceae bacterium]|nr:thiamine phosphate synthase [Paracoccaceae bacterium]